MLADLRTVWVTANVSEVNVAKLNKIKNGTFRMSATAYPGREFSARLLSVGAIVDSQTRRLPVLAQAENAEGLFKLGMFVHDPPRQLRDRESSYRSAAAVVEIEGQNYVFIPAKNAHDETLRSRRGPWRSARKTGDSSW